MAGTTPAERAAHLAPYRFKPGQVANPRGGKSRQQTLEELFDRVLRERVVTGADAAEALGVPLTRKLPRRELIARTIVLAATRGDTEAQRMLLDRLWPKPQKLELDLPGETLAAAEELLEQRVERAFARAMNGHDADPPGPTAPGAP